MLASKTEVCLGSELWCRQDHILRLHGSSRACENRRSRIRDVDSDPEAGKLPILPKGDLMACQYQFAEKCLGTEAYCLRKRSPWETAQCFKQRQPLPFYRIHSKECNDARDSMDAEACLGSIAWCGHETRIALWGSRNRCLQYRERQPRDRMPLRYPSGDGSCRGDEEACMGTEFVCTRLVDSDWRNECFAERQTALFLAANSTGCVAGAEGEDERCEGTAAWCRRLYEKNNYADAGDCFKIRDFNYHGFRAQVRDRLKEQVKTDVLDSGMPLARAAIFSAVAKLKTNEDTPEQIRDRVRALLREFLGRVRLDARETASRSVEMIGRG
ncbi:hypothetical protein CDD80_5771 [Ophiocordyceps camponoti-rufipedis]|uniref:Uncharacterized protein n=1 Tax=Ophiocordyceps camponoti-rufipedis TaxID=2004952 RepID=A0A2C5YUZ2_9HYPO|nr:hypothetical protein CDD80_5771 [Ophiocordyceps camponoti-rufipedis]